MTAMNTTDATSFSLASPGATRAVLKRFGLQTKHALGQNFLINEEVLHKILGLAQLDAADSVLEVGPGIGTLTVALLQQAGFVTTVERDSDLMAALEDTLTPWADRVVIVEKDAVEIDSFDLPLLPDKFVANLPYAIAATVVLDYFQRFETLKSAVVMVQKEVADRMTASPNTKDYGAYTVKLGLYAHFRNRFDVAPDNFMPQPHVTSTVIALDRHDLEDEQGEKLTPGDLKAICTFADAAFFARRKTLANSCQAYFKQQETAGGRRTVGACEAVNKRGQADGRTQAALAEIFERCDIDPRRRGETLDQQEFISVGCALRPYLESA